MVNSPLMTESPPTVAPEAGAPSAVTGRSGSSRVRRRLTLTQRLVTLAFFVGGSSLFLWRVWDRLAHPGMWAEDASIFFLQDRTRGLGALFSEYAGYLHLIVRIPAALVGPFGLPAAPLAYAVIGTVTTVLIFATVLSPLLDRVLPTVYGRGFAFLGLCAIPAMHENGANLLNLIFVGGVAILLLGLAREPVTPGGKVLELGALLLLGLSGPLIVFFSPLFAWRWWLQRSRYNLVVVGVVAFTAGAQLLVYLTSTRRAGGGGGTEELVRLYLQRVVGEWLTGPYAAMNSWERSGYIVPTSILWLSVVVLGALWFIRTRALLAILLTISSTAAAAFTYGEIMKFPWSGDRHLVVPMAALIVLAVGSVDWAVQQVRVQRGVRLVVSTVLGVLVLGACGWAISGVSSHFFVDRYAYVTPEKDLVRWQECFDAGYQTCSIRIAPYPHRLDLDHA
jgi:hypothetical protein